MENIDGYRQLSSIKIAWLGLSKFIEDYGIKKDDTYKEKIERIRLLTVDKLTPEKDKEQMISVLKILDKIANCDLCHQEIDWEKQRAMSDQEETLGRHVACHEKENGKEKT